MSPTTVFPARNIVTMCGSQPHADAVAVREGRILAVGSLDECRSWGDHSVDRRFEDLVLVPGMIEAHAHVLEGVFDLLPYVGWFDRPTSAGGFTPGIRTYEALLDRLRQLDADTAGSEDPIVVGGFDPIYFRDEERLTRHHLDRVSETRPIFVFHASSHLATVNSAMLAAHDITRDATTPGVGRDTAGEPNGELQEIPAISLALSGIMVIGEAMGDPEAIRRLGYLSRNQGITLVCDIAASGISNPDGQATWHDVVDSADFPARVGQRHIAGTPGSGSDWTAAADAVVALQDQGTEKLPTIGVKLMLDGSIQGWTAKMDWPGYYSGEDHGQWMLPPEQLVDVARPFHQRKVNIHTHCNGDLTIDVFIDAVEELVIDYPWLDHRHTVQHCQLTTAAQFRRMARLGMCANIFSNHIWYWGDEHHDLTVGPERARRMEPAGTAARAGVPFSLHSDAAVTPLSQLHTMWCAVNRVTASGRTLGEDEKISAAEALAAVTIGSAYQLHLDASHGSIECGKVADFTVLEDDPLTVDPTTIRDLGVWGTVVGGEPFEAVGP